MDEKTMQETLQTLTLQEKATLCSGMDFWQTQPLLHRGIPSLRMADGPHGVRVEDRAHKKENGGPNRPATCFPPAVTLACSFSPDLCREVGSAIAEEALHYGVGLLLGPGVNIKRSPLGGRNFEYYSEDPLLAGQLAAGFIDGVQQNGVGTSLKHFAVNNQETFRMSINAAVDERALYDIYLKAFEIALKEAQPATVMASYNRVNGQYATESPRLLTDILRRQFGFTGAVVSDWGAVNNRPAGIAAGCDLEMPYSGRVTRDAIVQAVQDGSLPEEALDTAVANILQLVQRYTRQGKPAPAANWRAHHALAATALAKSAVLLKNDAMLPLSGGGRVAVIGELAAKPRYQGSGSSVINPTRLVPFLSAMKAAGHPFVYAPGYHGDIITPGMLLAATQAARGAEKVLLFLGLPDKYEGETYDRPHLRLPPAQLKLLRAVSRANPNVCVVLCCGSPVETPWIDDVKALLCLHLGGQNLGTAAVRLLYGQDNPGGKLAESWPLKLCDTPAAGHFPMGPNEVSYNESIFVGYRYYDTAQKPVRFPFGYGLSYTSFSYSGLALKAKTLKKDAALQFSFSVKNTGAVAGDEIVQVYLSRKGSAAFQPKQELIAFRRVSLAPGEKQQLSFVLPFQSLAFYDVENARPAVEKGEYQLRVGACSRDIRLRATFMADGETLLPSFAASAGGPYGHIRDNCFATEDFAPLYQKRLTTNRLPRRGEYTPTTPLGLMGQSASGRALLGLANFVAARALRFSADKAANKKAAAAASFDLPFKNLVLNTAGLIPPHAAEELLRLLNGNGSWRRVLRRIAAQFHTAPPPEEPE